MTLTAWDKLHMLHRCWRLRFKSEVPSIQYLRELPLCGSTVLDIGANKGVFSVYLSRAVGPRGKLIAFEAQPELGAHLNAVKQSFRLDNMTLVNQGLSSAPGILTMRRSEAGSGMASFHKQADDTLEEIEIPVIALDEYAEQNDIGPVRFIKCDVESHELPVFMGGERLLRRDCPTLLFECHDSEADSGELFSFLLQLGYDGFFFYVSPNDHAGLLHKGRGEFVHFSKRADYDHVRPNVKHRNYVFVRKGSKP
jgi:FkbM family methyltransferase